MVTQELPHLREAMVKQLEFEQHGTRTYWRLYQYISVHDVPRVLRWIVKYPHLCEALYRDAKEYQRQQEAA
jgi:light-regulated signal transduction histidine kinase (bacteriophytochrome)